MPATSRHPCTCIVQRQGGLPAQNLVRKARVCKALRYIARAAGRNLVRDSSATGLLKRAYQIGFVARTGSPYTVALMENANVRQPTPSIALLVQHPAHIVVKVLQGLRHATALPFTALPKIRPRRSKKSGVVMLEARLCNV